MAEIKMPQLGESVTEGTIGKWLKSVGDAVTKYEPVAEVITDKVTAEVPSDFDGIIEEIFLAEGETVSVGTLMCRVTVEGEAGGEAFKVDRSATDDGPMNSTDSSGTDDRPIKSANGSVTDDGPMKSAEGPTTVGSGSGGSERPGSQTTSSSPPTASPSTSTATGGDGQPNLGARGRFSPAVLKLAEEHDVDLSQVNGRGENGRITRKDVLAFVAQMDSRQSTGATSLDSAAVRSQTSSVSPTAESGQSGTVMQREPVQTDTALSQAGDPGPRTGRPGSDSGEDEEWVTPSPIRKTIAKRMVDSKHTAPHAWTMVEADVTPLAQFRTRVKQDFKRREGIDLTYLPFFIKAVVEALKRYPLMNASWIDDKIVMHRRIHISIAVATDDALVVPVIHDADRLSIAGLAHSVNELAAKARSNRLTMHDIEGGTFTVNNTGAFGSVLSQPIINAPQAAILSIESIVKRPVVVENDAIAIRSMVNLCLSLDHRVLDGWITGQFLRAVRERLFAFDDQTVLY